MVTVEIRTGEFRVVHTLLEQDVTKIVEVEALVIVFVLPVLDDLVLAIAATLDRKPSPELVPDVEGDPLFEVGAGLWFPVVGNGSSAPVVGRGVSFDDGRALPVLILD